MARDALSAGDRIAAETYYQHAEHYFRILNSSTDPVPTERRQAARTGGNGRAQRAPWIQPDRGAASPQVAPAGHDAPETASGPDGQRQMQPEGSLRAEPGNGAQGPDGLRQDNRASGASEQPTACPPEPGDKEPPGEDAAGNDPAGA